MGDGSKVGIFCKTKADCEWLKSVLNAGHLYEELVASK